LITIFNIYDIIDPKDGIEGTREKEGGNYESQHKKSVDRQIP
jgi:hypothetical protein